MKSPLMPYPAMKDSGVVWLGVVPSHWELHRLATITEMRASNVDKHSKVDEKPVRLCNYVDVYKNERVHAGIRFMRVTASEQEIERFRLARGDILITKDSEDWRDIGVPALVEYVAADLLCGYHVAILRPHTAIVGDYLLRALQSRPIAWQFRVAAAGVTRYGLTHNAIRSVRVPLPPLAEQTAIARFFNHADRRIQRYIRAKERLIELLEEQKQAIIHQAVTGQIDVRTGQPYAAYKDSGVEWLGEVPQHWTVVQLGRIAVDRCDGPFGSGLKSSHYTDEGIRVVRLQNIGHGEFRNSDAAFISPEHYSTLGDHSVEAGDVLIAGLGDANHPAGRACVAPGDSGPAMVKADCFRFRLDQSRALPRFVALQLTSTAHSVSGLLSTGATRQRINLRTTAARRVAIPETREQSRIVQHLTHGITCHVEGQDNAGRAIELLSEYRTRLIADVVTGKLDVREAAASLPEIDSLDEHLHRCEFDRSTPKGLQAADPALHSPHP